MDMDLRWVKEKERVEEKSEWERCEASASSQSTGNR